MAFITQMSKWEDTEYWAKKFWRNVFIKQWANFL